MVNWLKSLFKAPEKYEDITAREAQVIAEGSLLIDDDKDFMILWKDISKKIKQLSGKNIRKLEFEITQTKYLNKISDEFVTRDILEMNPKIKEKAQFPCGSVSDYWGFKAEFLKSIREKIEAKGFSAEIITWYSTRKNFNGELYFEIDEEVKQTVEITW